MTAESGIASSLDEQSLMLARLAAVDAPPISYTLNLGAAADTGLDAEAARGVLAAIAPIIDTPRVAAAMGNIVEALAIELEGAPQG
jgi:hypothetical protein